tara:strand:- start:2639 stop:3220 length:582 start_codon:yes stop_codon:yes gene_type:complete
MRILESHKKRSSKEMKKLEEVIIDMKNNPRPSPDWDVIHQQQGEDEWSGQDYTASDSEYEEFQDNVDDFGIGSMDGKNVGDSSYFGKGGVGIELLSRSMEEMSEPNSDGDIEEAQCIEAYKLTFSCGVILVTVKFSFGSISDGDFERYEHKLNFYCYADGEDWHSHDPATHHHAYWGEMLFDVENVEGVEDDD